MLKNIMKKSIFVFTFICLLFSYKTIVKAETYYLYENYIDSDGRVLYNNNTEMYSEKASFATLTYDEKEKIWILSADGFDKLVDSKSGLNLLMLNEIENSENCTSDYVSIENIGNEVGVKCLTDMTDEKYIEYQKNMYNYNNLFLRKRDFSDEYGSHTKFKFLYSKMTITTDDWLEDLTIKSNKIKIIDREENSVLASSVFTTNYSTYSESLHQPAVVFKYNQYLELSSEDLNDVKYIFTKKELPYNRDQYIGEVANALKSNTKSLKHPMLTKYSESSSYNRAYYTYIASRDYWKNKIKELNQKLEEVCVDPYSNSCTSAKSYTNSVRNSFKNWFKNIETWSLINSFNKENRAKITNDTNLSDIEYFLFYEFYAAEVLDKNVYLPMILSFSNIYDQNDSNLINSVLISNLVDNVCSEKVIPSLTFNKVGGIEYYNNKTKVEVLNECKNALSSNEYYKNNSRKIVEKCEKSDEIKNICIIDEVINKSDIEKDCKTKAEKVCTYKYQDGNFYCSNEHKKTRDQYINECKNDNMLYKIYNAIHEKYDDSNISENKDKIDDLLEKINNGEASAANKNMIIPKIDIKDAEVDCKDFTLLHWVWNAIVIAAPFLLVIFAIIDYFKVVIQSNDEGMKALKKNLPKRVISLILLILVPTILYIIFSFVGTDSKIIESAKCIIRGE